MAITLEQAKALQFGDYVFSTEDKNADGKTFRAYKVNGKVQTWKRSPERVRVPVKRGLYQFDYITERDLEFVNLK